MIQQFHFCADKIIIQKSSTTHNSQDMGIAKCPWMNDKEDVVPLYNEILIVIV